jgi:hypothetical protein
MLERSPARDARLADVALVVVGMLAGFVRDFSEDFHWHVVLGAWTLDHRALMRRDVLSHTFSGARQFIDYWISDVLLAVGYRTFGYPGCYALRGIALAVTLVLLARESRRLGLASWCAALGPLLWLGELLFRAYLRPETFTFPLLAALLWLLGHYEEHSDRRSLFAIPLVVLAWANMHSSVAIALLVLACYSAEGLARAIARRDGARVREMLALAGASFAAACVNPEGLREPLMFLRVTSADPTFQAGVDWRPLSLANMTPLFPVLVAVVVVTTALAARRISPWRAASFALLFGLALWHARFVKTALLVAVPLVAGNVATLGARFSARFGVARAARTRLGLALLTTLATGFLWLREQHVERELGLGLDPGAYPEAACRFVHEHPLRGEMLNAFDFGSYLLFCLPEHRTYIDQRAATLYTPEFSREYRKLPNDTALFERRMAEHRVGFAFVAYDPLAKTLAARNDWKLVYVDDLAQVYARRSLLSPGSAGFEWLNPSSLASLAALPAQARDAARQELALERARCSNCRITTLFAAALGTSSDLARVIATPSGAEDQDTALFRGIDAYRHGQLGRAVELFDACLQRGTDPIGAAVWIDRTLSRAGQTAQRRVLRDALRDAAPAGKAQELALEELQRAP